LEALQLRTYSSTSTAANEAEDRMGTDVLEALQLRPYSTDVFEAVCTQAHSIAHEFNPQGLSNFLWACAFLNLSLSRELMASLCTRAVQVIDQCDCHAVSNILWACAVLDAPQGAMGETQTQTQNQTQAAQTQTQTQTQTQSGNISMEGIRIFNAAHRQISAILGERYANDPMTGQKTPRQSSAILGEGLGEGYANDPITGQKHPRQNSAILGEGYANVPMTGQKQELFEQHGALSQSHENMEGVLRHSHANIEGVLRQNHANMEGNSVNADLGNARNGRDAETESNVDDGVRGKHANGRKRQRSKRRQKI
jgi:hypothetical protein